MIEKYEVTPAENSQSILGRWLPAYVFSEPYLAEKAGAKPRSLMVSDLGFNPYASVLIAEAKTIERQTDTVRRMARACQQGWEHYLFDPAATNHRIAELNSEMSLEILQYGAAALPDLCDPGDAPFGTTNAGRLWQYKCTRLACSKVPTRTAPTC
jgi:NitT/TauT family transport system substrate-binding protein